MSNCLIAQSGGPTSVINSSVVGVYDENLKHRYYDNVYAGINGIEGILQENIINLSDMSYEKIQTLKYTPASGLGSCRYKLKDFRENDEEYKKLIDILKKLDVETFLYIGGNDSMDTVHKLSEYVKYANIDIKILGIPKTIDNDLPFTDHTPGFGSAAKFIATTTLETYLDSSVYINNGIFIIEAMGRDTGWLTASSVLAQIDGKPIVDFIYLPEVPFSKEKFIEDVKRRFSEKNQVFIVVSEGIKDKDGNFVSNMNTGGVHDKFGHAQLGGVCNVLKNWLIQSGVTKRVKTLELGVMQRCALHCASKTDIDEAYEVGKAAVSYSIKGKSGYMVGIERVNTEPYVSKAFLIKASEVANNVKYIPKHWINKEGNNVTEDAFKYALPLIIGTPQVNTEHGLPKYIKLR
ncbi:6-phosphofructokinase [Haloimpatiens sp. FM7330]|uniref:6-phosphofructokinase n=1 Tax=Haloimpatiens sp. FM7330 TaxID=3298610 RepID=UPI003640FA70